MTPAQILDLDSLRATSAQSDPYRHLIVPGFVRQEALPGIQADFPRIEVSGSVPCSELAYGARFEALLDALRGDAFRDLIAEKLDIDLAGRPTMVTVRGRARAKDGRIHADSTSKLVTVLIYMNGTWEAQGGRLRLLRSPDSLDNPVAEVPPDQGTLLAFRVSPDSWHGHEPFVGERRVIQLNWVTGQDVVRHEQARHRLTARMKRLVPLLG